MMLKSPGLILKKLLYDFIFDVPEDKTKKTKKNLLHITLCEMLIIVDDFIIYHFVQTSRCIYSSYFVLSLLFYVFGIHFLLS